MPLLFPTGDDKPDDLPEEPDLRDVPLHESQPEDASKVVRPGVGATGGDLSVTTAILANAGEDKLQSGAGAYVGEGLPPIPPKLAKKIVAGEYIEMEELLPEMCTREEGEPGAKRRCLRRASDIFTWLQCFGAYVSVRGAQFPEMIPELMVYMGTILRAQRIRGTGVAQVRHCVSQARRTKEGDEVVSDQHYHLRKMFHASDEKPTKM